MTKRWLAIFLTLVLVLPCLAMPAFADETLTAPTIGAGAEVTGGFKVVVTPYVDTQKIRYNYGLTSGDVKKPTATEGNVYDATTGIVIPEPGEYLIYAIAYDTAGAWSPVAESTQTYTVTPTAVALSTSFLEISGRKTSTITATVTPAKASQKVAWSFTDTAGTAITAASVGVTVDSSINVASSQSIKFTTDGTAGDFFIVATAGTKTAKTLVRVTAVSVTSIEVVDSVTVAQGETAKFSAKALPADASDLKLKATVDPAVTGLTATPAALAAAASDGSVTCTVSATTAVAVGSYKVKVESANGVGKFVTVNVVAAGDTAPAPTFSVASGTVLTKTTDTVTVSNAAGNTMVLTLNGATTAKTSYAFADRVVADNTITITAQTAAGSKYKYPSAVVTATYTYEIPSTGIKLYEGNDNTGAAIADKAKRTLYGYADTLNIFGEVAPVGDAKDATVTFTSSQPDVATVAYKKNDTSKKIATVSTVAPGKTVITATTGDGKFSTSFTLTVTEVKASIIKLYDEENALFSDASVPLNKGEFKKLTAKAYGTVTGVGEKLANDQNFTWASENAAIATVENGKIVAVKADDNTNVTVAHANITKKTSIGVFVNKDVPTAIAPLTIAPAGATYAAEQTVTIKTDTDGVDIYYTLDGTIPTTASTKYVEGGFKLSGPKSVTVKAIGVKTGLTQVFAEVKYTFDIKVTKIALDKTASVEVSKTLQFAATVTPDNATEKGLTWEIVAGATAIDSKIDAKTGLFTAGKVAGTATVKATAKDGSTVNASCVVTVKEAPIATLSIIPAEVTLNIKDKQQLTFKAVRQSKQAGGVWTSSNDKIATVSTSGEVVAVAAGEATISLTLEGETATAKVTVLADPVIIPAVPTKAVTYATTSKTFKAESNSSLTAVLGKLTPGSGETLEQLFYYNQVKVVSAKLDAITGTNYTIDKDGTISVNILNVGAETLFFDYTVTLAEKRGATPPTLTGGAVTGNVVVITKVAVDEIKFTADTVTPIEGKFDEIDATVTLGTITNYADLIKNGCKLTATVNQTGDAWKTAISDTGVVTLAVKAPAAGEYEAIVTIAGTDAAGIALKSVAAPAVKVSAKNFEIAIEDAIVEPVTMFDNQTKTVEVAKVTNLAVLTAAGYTLSVEPYVLMTDKGVSVTVTEGWTAAIDALGAITITAKEPVVGIYQAQVKVSAANAAGTKLADVYTSKLAVTVEEEGYADIVVESGLYAFDAKGALNLAKSQLTGVKFVLSNGREATWSTNKPKFLSIAANGAATFNTKKGDKCIVTATYTDKSGEKKTVQETVKVVKVAAAFKFQSKKGTAKWKNFTSGVVNVDITGTPAVKVRLTGKHGPSAYIEWKAFESTAGDEIIKVNDIGTDCLITPQKIGTCTLMVSDFTGASKLLTVNVVADLKDVEPEAKTEKVADFIEIG